MTGSVRERAGRIRVSSPRLLVLGAVIWAYCYVALDLLGRRLSASRSLWDTDFAIFRQTGYLIRKGDLGEVYRFIPDKAVDIAAYPSVWQTYLSHVEGYYYAQAPWHTLFMIPFGFIDYEAGFVLYTLIMILSFLGAALLLGNYTTYSVSWVTAFLAAPFLIPFTVVETWGTHDFAWHWIVLDGPIQFETVFGATLWYGQYTPLLLALLTTAFVAANRNRLRLAGALLVLATMKPNVLFGVPLILLVTDEWSPLIRWTLFWALSFNIVFSLVPFLGYPGDFVHLVFSYTEVFWPIVLQAHNYVWMVGIVIVTLALRFDSVEEPAAVDIF